MIFRKNKTNKENKLARILAGVIAASPLSAFAEDTVQQVEPVRQVQVQLEQEKPHPISGFVEITPVSKYVWYGLVYSNKPGVFGTLGLNSPHLPGLTLMGFTNFDTETNKFNETDIIVDYTRNLEKKVNASLGFAYYRFPNTTFSDTAEIYAGLSLDSILNPSLSVHYDYRDGSGLFAEVSASHNTKVLGIPVCLRAALGYNKGYFIEGEGLSHLESTISFPISIGKNVKITPFVSHQDSLSDEIETETWGGVKACWSF